MQHDKLISAMAQIETLLKEVEMRTDPNDERLHFINNAAMIAHGVRQVTESENRCRD